jgi:NAD(P)H-hydrate epimerase
MLLSREQARALDQRAMTEYGVPGIVLMENAGRNMAELLRRLHTGGSVVICCGPGNNGGDGFVMARHLDNAGIAVRVLLFGSVEQLRGDAAINGHILLRSQVPLLAWPTFAPEDLARELAGASWIVDALFGSGLRGPVRSPFDQVIEAINAAGAPVLAVDIPSGLDCDTGRPMGATVRAQHTATVGALKKGFPEAGAAAWLGQVHVIDMGAPRRLLAEGEHGQTEKEDRA